MKDTIPSHNFVSALNVLNIDPILKFPVSSHLYDQIVAKDSILARTSQAYYNIYANNTNNIQQTNFVIKKYGSSQI
jgi:hypothetical protein